MNNTGKHWLIIGGGTAGCYLVERLTSLFDVDITLVESGADRRYDSNVIDADKIGNVMFNSEYTRPFESPEGIVRMGSGLGGSSGINGGYAVFPSSSYYDLLTNEGKVNWEVPVAEVKKQLPLTTRQASKTIIELANFSNGLAVDDTMYISNNKRISGLTFLEKTIGDKRLKIITGRTARSISQVPGNNSQFIVLLDNFEYVTADYTIITCGAGTPELFLRSGFNLNGGGVKCHVGKKFDHNFSDQKNYGQIFYRNFDDQKNYGRYNTQLLIYGSSVSTFYLTPSLGWTPTLSSRGELYYTGKMMSDEDNQYLDTCTTKIQKIFGTSQNTTLSLTYHMVGGCQNIVTNFKVKNTSNLYIADLSILNEIPDANTSFMAFVVAEKFIQELLAGTIN
jgi:hypothetical protein